MTEFDSRNAPQVVVYAEESTRITLFGCRWIPSSARFVVNGSTECGDGIVAIYSFDGQAAVEKQTQAVNKAHPIKCLSFGAASNAERILASGDFGGVLSLWDIERLDNGPISSVHAHTDIINALGGSNTPSQLTTGSRDGSVKVWDPRRDFNTGPVVVMQPRNGDNIKQHDCWAVALGDGGQMLAAGYDNGDIKLFDLRSVCVHWETCVPNGVCGLQFDRASTVPMNKLLATGLEGRFHVWDMRTYHPTLGYTGLSIVRNKGSTLWGGFHLPDNRDVFMTIGGSGSLNLWKYRYPSKRSESHKNDGLSKGVIGEVIHLKETSVGDQPVADFDWSPSKNGLAVCTSFDQKIRIIIVTKLNTL